MVQRSTQCAMQTGYRMKAPDMLFPHQQSLESWSLAQSVPTNTAEYERVSAKPCREFGAALHE